MASTRSASQAAPFHLIRVGSTAPQAAHEYLAAFQCGFILRQANIPVADRFDVVPSYRGRKEVERLVRKNHCGNRFSKQIREQFAKTITTTV